MRRLLCLILLLVVAAPAQAQEFSATVSPESVVFGRDTTVTWRITVKTQEQAAEFGLRLSADGVSPAQHGAPGFRLTRVDTSAVRMEGPGTPWPGSTYGLTVRIGDRVLELPRATVGGRTGVPIAIATDPAGSASICAEPPRFARGKPVVISGRTDPALAGERLTLDWYGPGDAPGQSIGDVVVQPDGWFRLDGWVPPPGEQSVGRATRPSVRIARMTSRIRSGSWSRSRRHPRSRQRCSAGRSSTGPSRSCA